MRLLRAINILALLGTLGLIFLFADMIGTINIILIMATLWLIGFFIIKSSQGTKKQEDINRRFLEAEEAANNVRKKEIPQELFYVADLGLLPPISEDDPYKVQRCANRKMIRFATPVTNLELKQQYGLAQMDNIALYEENFHEYLKALTIWAAALTDENQDEAALSVLEHAILLGSEFRNTYKLAADVCVRFNDAEGLTFLREKVEENHFKDPTVRQHVIEYISSKLNELGHYELYN